MKKEKECCGNFRNCISPLPWSCWKDLVQEEALDFKCKLHGNEVGRKRHAMLK